jgi:hypothetical protein
MIINTALAADRVDTGDVQMDERLKKLVKRRHELIAEGREIEREIREIDRLLVEQRIEQQFAGAK